MKNFVIIGVWIIAAFSFVAAVFMLFTVEDIWVSLRWLGITILAIAAAIELGSVEGPEER